MVNLEDKLYDAQVCSPAQNYCRNRYVMEEAAQKIKRLECRVGEILSASEGLANWCDALIEMVLDTSCSPDDPQAFDEVVMGAQTFLHRYRKAVHND